MVELTSAVTVHHNVQKRYEMLTNKYQLSQTDPRDALPHTHRAVHSYVINCQDQTTARLSRWASFLLVTIRDTILTCAQKPTCVSLIYRTEPTTNKKLSYRRWTARRAVSVKTALNDAQMWVRRWCSRVAGERKTEFGYFACEKKQKESKEKKQSCLQVKCQEKWWEAVRRICGGGFVDCLPKTFGVVGGWRHKAGVVLFFWKTGWACDIGCRETWRRTSHQQSEYVSRCFRHGGGWIEMPEGWQKTMDLMETGIWRAWWRWERVCQADRVRRGPSYLEGTVMSWEDFRSVRKEPTSMGRR